MNRTQLVIFKAEAERIKQKVLERRNSRTKRISPSSADRYMPDRHSGSSFSNREKTTRSSAVINIQRSSDDTISRQVTSNSRPIVHNNRSPNATHSFDWKQKENPPRNFRPSKDVDRTRLKSFSEDTAVEIVETVDFCSRKRVSDTAPIEICQPSTSKNTMHGNLPSVAVERNSNIEGKKKLVRIDTSEMISERKSNYVSIKTYQNSKDIGDARNKIPMVVVPDEINSQPTSSENNMLYNSSEDVIMTRYDSKVQEKEPLLNTHQQNVDGNTSVLVSEKINQSLKDGCDINTKTPVPKEVCSQLSISRNLGCNERSPAAVEKCYSDSTIQNIEPVERVLPSENFCEIIPNPVSRRSTLRNAVGTESSFKKPVIALDPIENHYLRNFISYLLQIQNNSNLWNLFIREDICIFGIFNNLRPEVQDIYARLIDLKFSWYRVSSLYLQDISIYLDPFINELIQNQFLVAEPNMVDLEELIGLLNLAELKSVCKTYSLRTDGKKETLAKSLVEFSQNVGEGVAKDVKASVFAKVLSILGRVVKLSYEPRQLILRTMILFALPLTNEMETDGRIPLLSTMSCVTTGRVVYPQYAIRPLQRIFPNRESFIGYHEALELEAVIKAEMAAKRLEEVLILHIAAYNQFTAILGNQTLREADAKHPLYLRCFTAGTVLARILTSSTECLKAKKLNEMAVIIYEALLNQHIYLQNFRGKWYEQLALIYIRQLKNIPQAVELLNEGMTESLSPIDRILLSIQAQSIVNRKKKNKTEIENCNILKSSIIVLRNPPEITIKARYFSSKSNGVSKLNYIYEAEEGIGQILYSIEEIVMLHYKRSGYVNGFQGGNVLSLSTFGIFFWDLLYDVYVADVFVCPYQMYPLDLESGEFYKNRSELITKRISEIEELWSDEEFRDHIKRVWQRENGKICLVSWTNFKNLEKFQILMDCIGRKVISKICYRIAKEFQVFRTGFPDILVQNPITKEIKFVGIKNKSDPLTPCQKSWLAYLQNAGAGVCACFTEITGPKSSKRKCEVADNTDALDMDDQSFSYEI